MPIHFNLLQALLLVLLSMLLSSEILNFVMEISGSAFPVFIGMLVLLILSSYSFGIVDLFLLAVTPITYGFLCASIGLFNYVKVNGLTPINQLTGDYGLFFLERMDSLIIEYNVFIGKQIINLTEIKSGFATNIYGLAIMFTLFWIVLWSMKVVKNQR